MTRCVSSSLTLKSLHVLNGRHACISFYFFGRLVPLEHHPQSHLRGFFE